MEATLETVHAPNDFAEALSAGAAIGDRKDSQTIAYAVVPAGYVLRSLEEFDGAPSRHRTTAKLNDVDSFVAYVQRFKSAATQVYFKIDSNPEFRAILNDHEADGPQWRDHVATYACPLAPEWATWMGANKRAFSQAEFAQFIEDNLPDIVEPVGADMLEISRNLEAKKKVNFTQGIRLSNGASEIQFEETIDGTAAKGKFAIPEIIKIGIPVFMNGERFAIDARFRYRINGSALSLSFDLVRPHKVMDAAVADVRKRIEDALSLKALFGTP